jgi:hypothetical protein
MHVTMPNAPRPWHRSVGLAVAVGLLTSSPAALARGRLAVLLSADDDVALADNLTEVAISTLATRRDGDLVGTQELRGRLLEILPPGGLEACITLPACLTEVKTASGADRAVFGVVHRDGDQVTLKLALVELATGAEASRFSQTIPYAVDGLIATLRQGLEASFANLPPPPAGPPAAATVMPVAHLALAQAVNASPNLHLEARPPAAVGGRSAMAAYVGVSAGALGLLALSTAVVLGDLANQPLRGDTRAEQQADLARLERYDDAATGFAIAGSILTATAVGALIWWLRSDEEARP